MPWYWLSRCRGAAELPVVCLPLPRFLALHRQAAPSPIAEMDELPLRKKRDTALASPFLKQSA